MPDRHGTGALVVHGRHMGAMRTARKHPLHKRRIVAFSGRIYFNPFRNQSGSIDIVQRSNNHPGMLQRGRIMTLKARAREKVERAGISNYSFDQDGLVMCGVRYTTPAWAKPEDRRLGEGC